MVQKWYLSKIAVSLVLFCCWMSNGSGQVIAGQSLLSSVAPYRDVLYGTLTPSLDSTIADLTGRANVVWIPDFSGTTGDTVYADIYMQNDTVAVSTFTLDVTFCTDMLTYVTTTTGTLNPSWIMFGGNESAPGKITVGAFAFGSIPAGSNGTLARIEFSVTCASCNNGDTCTLQFTRLADNLATFTSQPGTFTFSGGSAPTDTPVIPTETPTPLATVNAWHIPASAESCDYNAPMRNETTPTDPTAPVCIYGGVYPIGGASTFTLNYRINTGAWMTHDFTWTCGDSGNDYWWTKCDQGAGNWWVPGATFGDTVYYFIEVTNPGNATTYLYSETTPSRTSDLATAQADPYLFTYPVAPTDTPVAPTDTPIPPTNTPVGPTDTPVPPTDTPVPPTATPVPMATVNAWHIPLSTEACSYNARMRNPSSPVTPTDPVCIYTGVYPIQGAETVTLYYRINSGTWQPKTCEWECNDSPNDYWWTFCDTQLEQWIPGGTWGDTVYYYLKVTNPGALDTFLYDEASPNRTTDELTAQALPFHFTYPLPTATPTAAPPTNTPVAPTDTPVAPTNTPTAAATVNAWHIPASAEACDYNSTMRDAVAPTDPADPVCLYAGVNPIDGATAITLNYRINGGSWMQYELTWTCNDTPNAFWWSYCGDPLQWWMPGGTWGDMVEYYITVTNPGNLDTYLYNETAPDRTSDELVAQAAPYYFTYPETTVTPTPIGPTTTPVAPTDTPIPPTSTPITEPTINAWHIPSSAEACDYNATMREAVMPADPTLPVCIYAGVYPTTGAATVILHYQVNGGTWLETELNWTCNDSDNAFWWTHCDEVGSQWIPGTAMGDQVHYYLELTNPGNTTTYLYSETSPSRTALESEAQADPYHFTYQIPGEVPTFNSLGALLMLIMVSLSLMGVKARRR